MQQAILKGNHIIQVSKITIHPSFFSGSSETDDYNATILRLMLAILCPVIILGIALAIILLMMRHWHRRRMARLTSMEGSQDPDYTYRDELRVTAAGDSTLRV